MKRIPIAGLRQALGLSQVEVLSLPGGTPALARLLAPLAENGINLEFVAAHRGPGASPDLVLGVRKDQIAAVLGLLTGKREAGGRPQVRCREPAGMISLFPHRNRPEVIGNFLAAFQEERIDLWSLCFSLSAVSALMEESRVPRALLSLKDFFELPG